MQKIRIDEKISIWQKLEITFNDDVDLSDNEKIMKALKEANFYDISVVNTYLETENHLEYDEKTIEKL